MEQLAGATTSVTSDWQSMKDVQNATIEKKDGKFVITSTEFGDAFRNAILGQTGTEGSFDLSALALSEASVEITLAPDGFCEAMTVTMKGSVVSSGMTMTLEITANMTYSALPADFTVSAPADAAEFTAVSQEEMFGTAE